MNNEERLQILYERLDSLLMTDTDNQIYEDHVSRSVASYAQAIKTLTELKRKEDTDGEYHLHNG